MVKKWTIYSLSNMFSCGHLNRRVNLMMLQFFIVNAPTTPNITTTSPDCTYYDLMSSVGSIPDSDITINYQDSPVDFLLFLNKNEQTAPAVANNTLTASFPSDPEFWVDRIQIKSDEDITITLLLQTSQSCTDQDTGFSMTIDSNAKFTSTSLAGHTYINDIPFLKGNQRMACVSTIQINTYQTYPLDGQTFDLEVYVYGCKVQPGKHSYR